MDFFSTTFLALALAADAFTVSLSCGLLIQRIKINKALKIAIFFGVFQCIMPLIGWQLGIKFSNFISSFDHWIAFGLLTLIGAKMIYEASQPDHEKKKFNPLDLTTLLMLSLATSIDALAAGLGLSFLNVSIATIAILIGAMTFSLSFIGVFIGHRIGNKFNHQIELAGGLILIFIGSKILLEHLTA